MTGRHCVDWRTLHPIHTTTFILVKIHFGLIKRALGTDIYLNNDRDSQDTMFGNKISFVA